MWIAGNDPGVVGILDVLHQDARIIVDERIQFFASKKERSHDTALVYGLVGSVYDAGLDEPHKPVGKHLGMQAQVLVA